MAEKTVPVETSPEVSDDSRSETVQDAGQEVLGRTKSAATWKDPGPPPDGGLRAWTQVLMGHLVIMNTWGNINSFGVYETYYVELLNRSHADVAWIGSVQVFLVFFIGTFSGRLTDAGYFRPVFGGLVYPAMFQQLIGQIGYGWTMRALGFTTTGCLIVANLLARPRLPPRSTGPIVELAAFAEASYTLFAIGIFLVFWGVYFAFYYVSSFGVDTIGISENESFNLFLVLNGVGIIGRTLPAYLADKYTGPMNILLMVTIASIICAWSMIAVTSRGGLYAWTVVYGIVGNGLQAMFPATLSSLTTDLKKAGVRMGMIFTIVSFSVLTGPPIAGVLITRDNGRYVYAQAFAAASMVAGFVFLCGARLAATGKVLFSKI
ncbi:hypothetical protein KJ359_005855 [Pestalotiopsis sp. 9143b]|nr:hypothetical protein KJ359_005855 [Pestalotiopsis sp. 9143b]